MIKINPIKCQPIKPIKPVEQAKTWVYVFTGIKLKQPVGDLFEKQEG